MNEEALGLLSVLTAVFIVVRSLAALASWIERSRDRVIACQIRLTEAFFSIGVILSPVVQKRAWGRWTVVLRLPEAFADVSELVSMVYDILCGEGIASRAIRIVLIRDRRSSNTSPRGSPKSLAGDRPVFRVPNTQAG